MWLEIKWNFFFGLTMVVQCLIFVLCIFRMVSNRWSTAYCCCFWSFFSFVCVCMLTFRKQTKVRIHTHTHSHKYFIRKIFFLNAIIYLKHTRIKWHSSGMNERMNGNKRNHSEPNIYERQHTHRTANNWTAAQPAIQPTDQQKGESKN